MKGYDNIPQLFQSVLDIPMYEGAGVAGALVHDIARPLLNKNMTLAGPPLWYQVPLSNITVLHFDSTNPDRLLLSAVDSADLAYTAESFSGVAWVQLHLLVGASRTIFSKWTAATSGWLFNILATGEIQFVTAQAGPVQISGSPAGSIVLDIWALVGFSRVGGSVRIYKNGVDITSLVVAHTDPVVDAGLFYVGVDSAIAEAYDGYLWRPRIVEREMSALDHADIFEMERGLFGI